MQGGREREEERRERRQVNIFEGRMGREEKIEEKGARREGNRRGPRQERQVGVSEGRVGREGRI